MTKGKVLQFITNRFDCTSDEIAAMYKSRWQIELFFKHIKQHMTIKKFFSQSEQGVI
jgi:Transposase DDE domain.